ncbi:MAG: alpha/beta fold hydrolase [Rubrobacteraceae bacterium]
MTGIPVLKTQKITVTPLEDGRRISYADYGDPEGRPVFYFHGSPGSREEGSLTHEAARKRGYRIIAPDRPGMGLSDYRKGYTLLDHVRDVSELANHLELETFGVMGHSGGGTLVLACAYAIPGRLEFAVDLAGFAPVGTTESLQKDLAALDRFYLRAASGVPEAIFRGLFSLVGVSARRLSPRKFVKTLSSSMGASDKRVVEDPAIAAFLRDDVREAFRHGARGPARDALLQYGDWGFRPEEIRFPIHLFHGTDDRFAPYSFAEYKARSIPGIELHTYPGEGHFFVWFRFDEIFDIVTAGTERRQP